MQLVTIQSDNQKRNQKCSESRLHFSTQTQCKSVEAFQGMLAAKLNYKFWKTMIKTHHLCDENSLGWSRIGWASLWNRCGFMIHRRRSLRVETNLAILENHIEASSWNLRSDMCHFEVVVGFLDAHHLEEIRAIGFNVPSLHIHGCFSRLNLLVCRIFALGEQKTTLHDQRRTTYGNTKWSRFASQKLHTIQIQSQAIRKPWPRKECLKALKKPLTRH